MLRTHHEHPLHVVEGEVETGVEPLEQDGDHEGDGPEDGELVDGEPAVKLDRGAVHHSTSAMRYRNPLLCKSPLDAEVGDRGYTVGEGKRVAKVDDHVEHIDEALGVRGRLHHVDVEPVELPAKLP